MEVEVVLQRATKFAANNAIAMVALFVALGGASYAATGAFTAAGGELKACVGNSHVIVLKTSGKPCGKKQKTVSWAQQGPAGAKGPNGASGASGAAGTPGASGAAGFSALSTLPSGASESGDYAVSDGNTVAEFLNQGFTFPIPLAAPLDGSHVSYIVGGSGPNCPGVGKADRGFLCVYSIGRGTIAEESIYSYDSGAFAAGSGRFGFDIEWVPLKTGAFDNGTWTVTAP
jgi:hypothetical protein